MRSRKRVDNRDVNVGASVAQVQRHVARSGLRRVVRGAGFARHLESARVVNERGLCESGSNRIVPKKPCISCLFAAKAMRSGWIFVRQWVAVGVA